MSELWDEVIRDMKNLASAMERGEVIPVSMGPTMKDALVLIRNQHIEIERLEKRVASQREWMVEHTSADDVLQWLAGVDRAILATDPGDLQEAE